MAAAANTAANLQDNACPVRNIGTSARHTARNQRAGVGVGTSRSLADSPQASRPPLTQRWSADAEVVGQGLSRLLADRLIDLPTWFAAGRADG